MESVFSMVTIMICFGICMLIFNMVSSSGTSGLQIEARIRLQEEAAQCKADSDFSDRLTASEKFTIERTFVPWNEEPSLTELQLVARNAAGKTIAEYHELLVHP